jgi:hypothetical protein
MPKVDRRSQGDFRPLRWLDAIVRRLDAILAETAYIKATLSSRCAWRLVADG